MISINTTKSKGTILNQYRYASSFRKHRIIDDGIDCLECGNTYKSLSSHIRFIHGMSGLEYRLKYGLKKGSLVSKELRDLYLKTNPEKSRIGSKKRKEYWSKKENRDIKAIEQSLTMSSRWLKMSEDERNIQSSGFFKMLNDKHNNFINQENTCLRCGKKYKPQDLVDNGTRKSIRSIGSVDSFKRIKYCSKSCRFNWKKI